MSVLLPRGSSQRARVGPRVTGRWMAPAVSEESTLLLLILLLPFGHLVELILGLPKDIVEIDIREIVLCSERREKGEVSFGFCRDWDTSIGCIPSSLCQC